MQKHALIRITTFWRASIFSRETKLGTGPPKLYGAFIISKNACDCLIRKTDKLGSSKAPLSQLKMALFGLSSYVQSMRKSFKQNL